MTTPKVSATPLGLPGRVMINVLPRTPVTERLSIAIGVNFKVSARIASAKPGTSRSIMDLQASGVTSRGPNPVPPVLTIRSTSGASAHSAMRWAIMSFSSETISYRATV